MFAYFRLHEQRVGLEDACDGDRFKPAVRARQVDSRRCGTGDVDTLQFVVKRLVHVARAMGAASDSRCES